MAVPTAGPDGAGATGWPAAGGQGAEGGTSLAWGLGTPPAPLVLAWSLLVAAFGLTSLVSLLPPTATSAIGLALALLAAAAWVARPEGPRPA